MTDSTAFTQLVPGFDFLQGLVKNAGAALPGIGQWVAPTIDPAELEKRIEELRTVQFWLEQNARMIGATIQALEVQRMTLSTLKTMNVQMEGLRDALHIRVPGVNAPPAAAPDSAHSTAPDATAPGAADEGLAAPGAVDPMQWWGALTQQFTELATNAMKDTAADAARKMATAMTQPLAAASSPPRAAAKSTRRPAAKAAAKKKPAVGKKTTPRS